MAPVQTPKDQADAIRQLEQLEGANPEVEMAYAYRTVDGPPFEGPRDAYVAGWVAARQQVADQGLTLVHLDEAHLLAAAQVLYTQMVENAKQARPALRLPAWDLLPPRTQAGRVDNLRKAVAALLPGD